jgi:DNA invertase Pin-like site-specific DNA recombinase
VRHPFFLFVRVRQSKSALKMLMRAIISNNQRRELEAVAERSGWHVKIYEDSGISGAKGRGGAELNLQSKRA